MSAGINRTVTPLMIRSAMEPAALAPLQTGCRCPDLLHFSISVPCLHWRFGIDMPAKRLQVGNNIGQ